MTPEIPRGTDGYGSRADFLLRAGQSVVFRRDWPPLRWASLPSGFAADARRQTAAGVQVAANAPAVRFR